MERESFVKNLRSILCTRIFDKELEYMAHKVRIYVFIRDIKLHNGKIQLIGLRVAGCIDLFRKQTELADIDYKMQLEKDGFIALILHNAIWTVLSSRLKHFNLTRADVDIGGKIHFMKVKRFFSHVKIYLPIDSIQK
jgi:hypothetical protein